MPAVLPSLIHAQDYAEALRWYRLKAAQGHAAAQYKLGDMFRNGEGVAQDKAEACDGIASPLTRAIEVPLDI